MARAAIRLAVALSVVWLNGCGTVLNITDNPDRRGAYGGVQTDAKAFGESCSYFCGPGREEGPPRYIAPIHALLCLVDLPLSIVGDTVTLPLTLLAETGMKEKEAGGGIRPAE